MIHARFGMIELRFDGPDAAIPADRTPLAVAFRHEAGHRVDVPGFWDGGDRYLVRFAPDLDGAWTWTSRSDEARELEGQSGSLLVGPAAEGEHGPVRAAGTFHFAHADGTPFRPVGATVYNWLHQDEPRFSETGEQLRRRHRTEHAREDREYRRERGDSADLRRQCDRDGCRGGLRRHRE